MQRLVKIALPAATVDKMDALLAQRVGGLESRSDFVREALDGYITELEIELSDGIMALNRGANRHASSPPSALTAEQNARAAHGALMPIKQPVLIADSQAIVEQAPLFFHNRDYTSLWAAYTLAELTRDRLIPFDVAVKEITKRAWRFAEELLRMPSGPLKPTVLFPTNREKRDASEAAFEAFAIGTCQENATVLKCDGPLFIWGICDVSNKDGTVLVGLTGDGWNLLTALNGLSPWMPHSAQFASIFLKYLKQHAPCDRWAIETICKLVARTPTREGLLKAFALEAAEHDYKWTVHQVANYVSGYIGRGREWGLIETKQVSGTYGLTEFGRSFV